MMMSSRFLAVALLLVQAAAADKYGPNNCVSVERSPQGSCVIATNCAGVDTSKFEFMFSCGNQDGTRVKHSFGVGGFDEVETYDTEVKCSSCHAPAQKPAAAVFAAAPTKEEKFRVASYGPNNCVSTYLSEKGTCILKTDCAAKSLDGFVFGLVCADAQGEMVRHVFGQNSYEDKETFDTLIPCTQCLGLDNFDSGKDTEEAVLKDEVETLKKDFQAINSRVAKLEEKAPPSLPPLPEEPKAEEPKAEAKAFLSHRRHAHQKKRHHKKHQDEEQEEEDSEEDREDDQDDQEDEQEASLSHKRHAHQKKRQHKKHQDEEQEEEGSEEDREDDQDDQDDQEDEQEED